MNKIRVLASASRRIGDIRNRPTEIGPIRGRLSVYGDVRRVRFVPSSVLFADRFVNRSFTVCSCSVRSLSARYPFLYMECDLSKTYLVGVLPPEFRVEWRAERKIQGENLTCGRKVSVSREEPNVTGREPVRNVVQAIVSGGMARDFAHPRRILSTMTHFHSNDVERDEFRRSQRSPGFRRCESSAGLHRPRR